MVGGTLRESYGGVLFEINGTAVSLHSIHSNILVICPDKTVFNITFSNLGSSLSVGSLHAPFMARAGA